jgi:hypothetical protein
MSLRLFELNRSGIIKLRDQSWRVIWQGKYCDHVHFSKDLAIKCLFVYDRAEIAARVWKA